MIAPREAPIQLDNETFILSAIAVKAIEAERQIKYPRDLRWQIQRAIVMYFEQER